MIPQPRKTALCSTPNSSVIPDANPTTYREIRLRLSPAHQRPPVPRKGRFRKLHGIAAEMARTNNFSEASVDSQSADLQSKAESAYQAHGLRAPARVFGEPVDDYRRRLLRPLLPHSNTWGAVSLSTLPDSALRIVEQEVFSDSVAAGTRSGHGAGPLREVVETDRSGRKISRFFGDPEDTWSPFKMESRDVTGWKT